MGAGNQDDRGRDVLDAAERQFFTSQIEAVHKSIQGLETHMTELFNTKIDNQGVTIQELKDTTKDHDGKIKELESFKEGHQSWHLDQKELEKGRKDDGRFRWEILVAFGGLAIAALALFL